LLKKILIGVICFLLIAVFVWTVIYLGRFEETLSANDKIGWGIKKNKGAPPDVPASVCEMLKKHNSYYIDISGEKKLYLTFDEGYENGYTGDILDTLKEHNVPAAFFVTKPYLEGESELIARMLDEGHIVGNHTMNHPDLTTLSDDEIRAELSGLNEIFNAKYGMDMKYMRPPEGAFSERVLSCAADAGYKTVFWSFAYRDWEVNNQKGADYAYSEVVPYLHDGAVILLHAVSHDNAAALGDIIKFAKAEGYTFCSLDELK